MNARVLSIEQTIAELEGKVLDMQTASLRAKQDIAKATQDATTLQNDRDTEIAQDRQQAEADIEEVTLKMAHEHEPDDGGAGQGSGGCKHGRRPKLHRRSAMRSCARRTERPARRRPTRTRRFFPETSSRSRPLCDPPQTDAEAMS